MNKFTEQEKTEFRKKSESLQQIAWDMKHKSETAYELGKFELCMKLDSAYCKYQEDSNYYFQLSY